MESPNRLSRPLSVLVVDDNADYAASCADVLACYGFTAAAVTSGAEALAVATRDRPDVVLLDLQMPFRSGWDLADALRRLERPPVLVAVSGCSSDATRDRSAAAGISLHLVKPVAPFRLVGVLKRLRCADVPEMAATAD